MDGQEARKLLDQRRKELERIRDFAREQLGPPPEEEELATYDQHPADLATDTIQREQHLSEIDMAEASLREVEEAMKRLDKGTYGVCEVGGEKIPDARLRALPEARTCVQHAAEAVV
jgi:RNA polymerase-binding transcription factor DksA